MNQDLVRHMEMTENKRADFSVAGGRE